MRRGYFTPPVLIILAVIIFAVAILIALNTDLVKRLKNQPSPTPSPSPTTQQSTPTPSETANWKVYTNVTSKYKLSYPPAWRSFECLSLKEKMPCFTSGDYVSAIGKPIEELSGEDSNSPKRGSILKVLSYPKEQGEIAKSCKDAGIPSGDCQEMIVDGFHTLKLIRRSHESVPSELKIASFSVVLLGEKFDHLISMDFPECKLASEGESECNENEIQASKAFDQILSTFRFE